jgi:hypothetical protein
MRKGVILFFIQIMLTFVAAFNMRSISQANYEWTIISEAIAGLMIFLSIKEIAEKANRIEKCIGFILGSIIGSILGIYLSKFVLKQ